MINKKCGISVLVFLVFCVIIGVLLGVLLPRGETDNRDSSLDLPETSPWYGNEEIRIFREYLRIPTVHPNIDYEPCVQFLKKQAVSLDLPVSVVYPVNEKNPVVIMTWLGSEPNRSSIMLNSHTDVVPVYEEFWLHPPFAADIDEDGKIFARGSQDTKSIGMIYLAAIRALKGSGIKQLKRTIHVTFVPDEEMGGLLGMAGFVESDDFATMNVGYALDEAGVSSTKIIEVLYDERCTWRMEFVCAGSTGHGSILFENTTGQKITYLINKFMEKRKFELDRMNNQQLSYGNVTTINLTVLKGGVQGNVIPPELSVVFDVRLAVDVDHDSFERQMHQWIEEAGGNITIKYIIKDPKARLTPTDSSNPVWVVLENTTKELDLEIIPIVPSGSTDMKYLRRLNISAFGFGPLINTPFLLHDHNEFLHADEYLAGINVYTKVLLKLGDI